MLARKTVFYFLRSTWYKFYAYVALQGSLGRSVPQKKKNSDIVIGKEDLYWSPLKLGLSDEG